MSNKLLHSFMWDFTGRISGQFIAFIIGIILARLLSPAEFGLIGMSMVFISISGIFTNMGLSASLIQRKDPTEEHYSSSFYLNISAAIFIAVLFVLLAPGIAAFFKNSEITNIIRVLSFTLIITSFSSVQETRLRKLMRFDILTKANISNALVSGLIGISMAYKGFGVWSLVLQTLVSRVYTTSYYWIASGWRPKFLFRYKAIKDLWSFGFNMFISSIIDTVYSQLDSIIIARAFSAIDLGLYTRAKTLNRFVIKYSSESIGATTFPAMAAINNNQDKMIELGLKAETLIAFVSFGLLGWLYVVSEPLILGLLGIKWAATISIFKILCLSGFAYPISSATLSMLKAAGYSKQFLKVEVWKKIFGFSGLCIGFYFGLKGFLISLIITGSIGVWLNMYFTGKSLGISVKHQLIPLLPYLIITLVASTAISLLPLKINSYILSFTLMTVMFLILYFGINALFKTKGQQHFINQVKQLIEKFSSRIKQ